MPDVEGVLEHYGKKGMKWGVRKSTHPASEDAAKVHEIKTQAKKQGKHTLTNEQLRTANQRLELESKFKKGTVRPKPALIKAGETAVISMLVAGGINQIKNTPRYARNVKQVMDVIDWEHFLTKAA